MILTRTETIRLLKGHDKTTSLTPKPDKTTYLAPYIRQNNLPCPLYPTKQPPNGFNVSFVDIHKINSKWTPQQIMLYQIALNLHRVLNSDTPLMFEKIYLLDQMVCGRRQLKFEILRNFQGKIGMNTMANKFYHILLNYYM